MSHDNESSIGRSIRRAALPLTAVTLASAVSAPVVTSENEINYSQQQGFAYYGFEDPNLIISSGDIGQGFVPVNGFSYGNQDAAMIIQDMTELKDVHTEFAMSSWEEKGDWRDKFMRFTLKDVMNRPDNTAPNFKWTAIYEKESHTNLTEEQLSSDLDYMTEYFNDPHWLRDKDGKPVLVVFAQDLEGIYDNPNYASMWARQAEERGMRVFLQDYPLNNLNPDYDKVSWYSYAAPFWDIRPSGYDETKDVARVTLGYQKHGDTKYIPRDINLIKRNIMSMITSSAEFGFIVSYDEYVEHSQADPPTMKVIMNTLPASVTY